VGGREKERVLLRSWLSTKATLRLPVTGEEPDEHVSCEWCEVLRNMEKVAYVKQLAD
jgi:hypothetical protein